MRMQELEVKSQNYWLMVAELRKAHQRDESHAWNQVVGESTIKVLLEQ